MSKYITIVKREMKYLDSMFSIGKNDNFFNFFVLNVGISVEKLFKGIIEIYCFDSDLNISQMKTHKLIKLYEVIKTKLAFKLSDAEIICLMKLSDYYFDLKYPSDISEIPIYEEEALEVKALLDKIYSFYLDLESDKLKGEKAIDKLRDVLK